MYWLDYNLECPPWWLASLPSPASPPRTGIIMLIYLDHAP